MRCLRYILSIASDYKNKMPSISLCNVLQHLYGMDFSCKQPEWTETPLQRAVRQQARHWQCTPLSENITELIPRKDMRILRNDNKMFDNEIRICSFFAKSVCHGVCQLKRKRKNFLGRSPPQPQSPKPSPKRNCMSDLLWLVVWCLCVFACVCVCVVI